ncbi:hypothetical protein IG631_18925 [Alternaria alternata]|nr:hypothetical protein IG631_18925 [Alternaria alternata]
MCRTNFKHIPLARPAEQIRLLKLQPGADVIRLNIQTYELTECPKFVALSYEWGHGSEIYDIIIDGGFFKIRQNLRDALEHIRTLQADTSSTRLFEEDSPCFWIDAIAIDQLNDWEKPHQVSVMGKIFGQAAHVVAWLGLEQPGDLSWWALDYLNTDPEVPFGHQKQSPYSVKVSARERAISRLCGRSYFQRMWIVQECVLARKLHFVCGLHYCSWKHLHKFSKSSHGEGISRPVNKLFNVKLRFESDWKSNSVQNNMKHTLDVANGRYCSRFHDRIYGLLGILQREYHTAGMEVDYGASLEELMIKTYDFLTSDFEEIYYADNAYYVLRVFDTVASVDVQGKVAWYWQMNEIMYKLDADIIKGFDSFETLCDEKVRALTFQTICWIVGAYGVDLFSPVEGTTPMENTTAMQTITLESRKKDEGRPSKNRVFTMHLRYTTGFYTYRLCLTRDPYEPESLPYRYMMTESNSRECRTLLEAYSKHVKSLSILRESSKVSTEASDWRTPPRLPIQVEWLVFSNLLAQHFYSKFEPSYRWGERPNRTTKTDGFVRETEREGKDLDTFLSESLFNKYRMNVTDATDELLTNALESVEIEITRSDDADDSFDFVRKTMVASLYDNYPETRPGRLRKPDVSK